MKKARPFTYNQSMRKGEATRQTILEHAAIQASKLGLNGLSIGQLAQELQMSKSGLFRHFQSKEELQIQVLDTISEQFTREVIQPALKVARGPERLRALFAGWLTWAAATHSERGGCPFVAAAMELDDMQGAVRDHLVQTQQLWIGVLERSLQLGQDCGAFHLGGSPHERVQELYGLMLSFHFYHRLLRDPGAEATARALFHAFLGRITKASKAFKNQEE